MEEILRQLKTKTTSLTWSSDWPAACDAIAPLQRQYDVIKTSQTGSDVAGNEPFSLLLFFLKFRFRLFSFIISTRNNGRSTCCGLRCLLLCMVKNPDYPDWNRIRIIRTGTIITRSQPGRTAVIPSICSKVLRLVLICFIFLYLLLLLSGDVTKLLPLRLARACFSIVLFTRFDFHLITFLPQKRSCQSTPKKTKTRAVVVQHLSRC